MTLAAFLRHLGFAALLILLSAATVRMMISVRVMDTPAARKVHDRPTPKGGGVGIVVTFLIGIAVLLPGRQWHCEESTGHSAGLAYACFCGCP